jgi:hypothetical protein
VSDLRPLRNAQILSPDREGGVPQMAHFLIAPLQSGQDRREAITHRGVLWAACARTRDAGVRVAWGIGTG